MALIRNIFLAFLFFCHLTSCSQKPDTSSLHLLFIGNSLTYTNHLPLLVSEVAQQEGVKIEFNSIAYPDYSLEDHWSKGKIQTEINNGKYNYVILQQGPSAASESQKLLLQYVEKIQRLCKKNNSKLIVFMVWPSNDRIFDLDNVIYSYSNAAKQTKSLLAPVGLAWKYAWQISSELPLYSSDEFHPSLLGSLLASITIYGAIKQKKSFDFINYHSCPWKNNIDSIQLKVLKDAASKALTD